MKIQVSINLNNAAQVKKKLNIFPPNLTPLKTNSVKEKEFTKDKKANENKVLYHSYEETSKQE